MARTCTSGADWTCFSKSVQRQLAKSHDSGQSQPRRPARPASWTWLGIEGITGYEDARGSRPVEHGVGRPVGECYRQSLGRTATGLDAADGYVAPPRATASGRAHRSAGPEERRPGDRVDRA